MALWPYQVVLAGTTIALADVLADVTIHHGREDVSSGAAASSCQLVFRDVDSAFVLNFDVGSTLAVTVRDGAAAAFPRFTGRITDAALDVDELTVIATGPFARLRTYPVGDVDWPAETWTARVSRLFVEAVGSAANLVLEPDPSFNPTLAARVAATAGPTTLGDYLDFLLPMVGALAADLPDGKTLVQALGARSYANPLVLAPADVGFAPQWREELPRGNIVTVRYQADQGAAVTVTEPASIAAYGERAETIDTSFAGSADASYRANLRLGRAAFSHWELPAAPVLLGLDVRLGRMVKLTGLPAASPYDPWTPVIEGWTDSIAGPAWTMLLALSDPLISGLSLPWDTVPVTAAYRWNTVDPATDWTEALTLDDLEVA